MVKVLTDQGEIGISNAVFTTITGAAATNCFGVKGMAYRSMTDGIVHLLRPEAMSKGVKVTYNEDNTVSIELHIIVENGYPLGKGGAGFIRFNLAASQENVLEGTDRLLRFCARQDIAWIYLLFRQAKRARRARPRKKSRMRCSNAAIAATAASSRWAAAW